MLRLLSSAKSPIILGILLVIIGLSVSLLAPHTAFAAGGVGSGGSGGGGASGGPWGWTTYGHGWALYPPSGAGPSAGFNSGSWATAKAACNGNSTSVAVYILGTGIAKGQPGYPNANGNYMAYDWQSFSGVWGGGGTIDHARATKISLATATAGYALLPSYGVPTGSFTFGGANGNVAWYCYGYFNTTVKPTVTPAAASIIRGSNATFTLKRTVTNYTAPAKTVKYRVAYRFNNAGSWLNIPTSQTTVYDNALTTPQNLTVSADLNAAAFVPNITFQASFIPATATSICVYTDYVAPIPTHVVFSGSPTSACTTITDPAPLPWSISGTSKPIKNGVVGGAGATIHVVPGDTFQFQHQLANSSTSASASPSINYSGVNSGTPSNGLAAGSVPGLNIGQSSALLKNTVYPVTIADVGKTFCQALSFNPTSSSNAAASPSAPACVIVDAPTVACTQTLSTIPTRLQPGDVANITLSFPAAAGGQTLTYTLASGLGSGSGIAIAGGQTTYVITNVTMPNAADDYGATWSVSSATGSCTGTVSVIDMPYFDVTGPAGVRAGGDFAGSCTGGGNLDAWHDTTGGNSYGSGVQLSAIAMVAIVGFASKEPVPLNSSSAALSFANTSVGAASSDSPTLGGNYGGSYCFSQPKKPTTGVQAGSASFSPSGKNGAFDFNGDVTINNGTINQGNNVSIFVSGDVYITGDIKYATTNWNADTQIPSFVIVANNIYIDPSVRQLDGLYVATNNASNTDGQIFTCANAAGPIISGSLYDSCNGQLVVNGTFVADKIHLLRTYGTLKDDTTNANCHNAGGPSSPSVASCAAEIFQFSPEIYLSKPAIQPQSNGAVHYDAINNLPPVL